LVRPNQVNGLGINGIQEDRGGGVLRLVNQFEGDAGRRRGIVCGHLPQMASNQARIGGRDSVVNSSKLWMLMMTFNAEAVALVTM